MSKQEMNDKQRDQAAMVRRNLRTALILVLLIGGSMAAFLNNFGVFG
ncbi:hypothetical protein [Chitinimonas sp. JJ19]